MKIKILKKNVYCKVTPSGVSFEISSSQLTVDRTSLLGRGLAFAFLSLYHIVPQFVADRLLAAHTSFAHIKLIRRLLCGRVRGQVPR